MGRRSLALLFAPSVISDANRRLIAQHADRPRSTDDRALAHTDHGDHAHDLDDALTVPARRLSRQAPDAQLTIAS
jgi:hypothetical protein